MSPFKSSYFSTICKVIIVGSIGLLLASSHAATQVSHVHASDEQEAIYLPIFTSEPLLATRMGFGVTWPSDGSGSGNDIATFAKSSELKAGWYLNWTVNPNPSRPNGIEFAQMIRVHQSLDCTDDNGNQRWWYKFRDECPYAQPTDDVSSFRYKPSQATIETAARNNPGSLWLVGNEIERKDWAVCAKRDEFGPDPFLCVEWVDHGGQDEILPETYAIAYHELYNILKAADPTARVAIGGVIQVTPLRIEYLTAIWDSYFARYGVPIPVDVWNIHTFHLKEDDGIGSEIPVGITSTEGNPMRIRDHIQMEFIEPQIYRMREWMKERGQQEKPLIISEYGTLYLNQYLEGEYANDDATPVIDFLIESSSFFLNTKDCNLGYTADDCRLVQKWNWFSLDGRAQSVNPVAPLLNPDTGELTATGEAWKVFVQENQADLYYDFD